MVISEQAAADIARKALYQKAMNRLNKIRTVAKLYL